VGSVGSVGTGHASPGSFKLGPKALGLNEPHPANIQTPLFYSGWLRNPASPKGWLKDAYHRFQLVIRISQPSTVCPKYV